MGPGFVTGLVFEADILRSAGHGLVACHGPGQKRAQAAALALVERGCSGLVSFGVAGALAGPWETGDIFIPDDILDEQGRRHSCDARWRARFDADTGGTLLSVSTPAVTAQQKRQLHEASGAHAVDMESAAIAAVADRHDLPFTALRVILDDAETAIPPCAMKGMRADGTTNAVATVLALARRPGDFPALMRLARADARARKALARLAHLAAGLVID